MSPLLNAVYLIHCGVQYQEVVSCGKYSLGLCICAVTNKTNGVGEARKDYYIEYNISHDIRRIFLLEYIIANLSKFVVIRVDADWYI